MGPMVGFSRFVLERRAFLATCYMQYDVLDISPCITGIWGDTVGIPTLFARRQSPVRTQHMSSVLDDFGADVAKPLFYRHVMSMFQS